MPIAHRTYRNGPGTQMETRNNPAESTHARVIRSRSTSARPPCTAYAPASTSRTTARLSTKTVTSPVDAGPTATAATPAGTLPARNRSRSAGVSAPRRL
jgi:hypothetical protein